MTTERYTDTWARVTAALNLALLLGVTGFLAGQPFGAARPVAVLCGVAGLVRGARIAVEADATGLTVTNVLRTRTVRWADIERFDVRPAYVLYSRYRFPRCPVAVTRGHGRPVLLAMPVVWQEWLFRPRVDPGYVRVVERWEHTYLRRPAEGGAAGRRVA
ncbi:MAG TPA: PH domain-containing protein [Mycobacteriales bacterium]|nr:PH domain-containing protein [Mycobacteriales bacterium]